MIRSITQLIVKAIVIIGFCSTLVACGGGDSDSSSSSTPESNLNTDSSGVDLSQPSSSSQLLTQQQSETEYDDKKTIKITNTGSSTIKHLSVHFSGNVTGVTASGCEGQLSEDKACHLTLKANSKAEGKGHVVVSGKGTADLSVPVFVGAAPLYFDHTTILKPSDSSAAGESFITITNDSKFPAKININKLAVVDGSGNSQHIAINRDYTKGDSCFKSKFKQGNIITLKESDMCELPVKVSQGAEGHALIKITGNFFRPQYAPVNIASASFKTSTTTSDQIKLKLDRNNMGIFPSGFNINQLKVALDGKISQSLSNFDPDQVRHLTFDNLSSGPHMLTFSGDNLSDNIDPMLDYVIADDAQSYLTITNVPRQNLKQSIQTPAFAGLNLTANSVTVNSIQLSNNIQAVKPGPVSTKNKYAGQSIAGCKNTLNSSGDGDKSCMLWLRPKDSNVKLADNDQKANLTVVYTDHKGHSHKQTVSFKVNRELVAGGNLKLPANQANKRHTQIDNSGFMSWDGSQWHWNQAGIIDFDDIEQMAVNKRGQPCVNDGSVFACFNGHKWLVNDTGMPVKNNPFKALVRLSNNQDWGNILSSSLVALTSQDPHKIYYLRPNATNSYFDGWQPSWQSFNFGKASWGNITVGNGKLFATLANSSKAVVAQISLKYAIHGGKNNRQTDIKKNLSNIGDPIAINRPSMTGQFALLAQGDNKVFVGGQKHGQPVVFENIQNTKGGWHSIGGPNVKGQIINLKHGANGPMMTVVAKDKNHGFVYQYKGSHHWQKVADKADPVSAAYYDSDTKHYFIGTDQSDLAKNSEKSHDIKDSFVLSHAPGQNKWSSVGGIKTYGGHVASLKPVDHIQITGYSQSE